MAHVSRFLLTAAGVATVALAGAITIGQDKPTAETEECANTDCHPGIVNRKVMHRPTADGECLACHEYDEPAEHTFALIVEAEELCWECHEVGDEEVVHAPVDEGNCAGCHDPHGSDHPAMLSKGLAQGLCLDCHDDLPYWDRKFVHGPVAAQACTACHEPHASPYEKLLSNPPTELCLDCHFGEIPADDDSVYRHQPVVEGGCAGCHDPHATDFRYQLRTETPQLCWECHDDVKLALDEAAIVHGPMADAGGCGSCHNPHYSTFPALLAGPQPGLCLQCHNDPVKTGEGRTLAGLAEVLEKNPDRHGPLRDGDCAACHRPHAGEHFRLLVEQYPPGLYARYEIERYELCFSCHEEDLADDESGTDLTGFRDGDRNLHWLHVNRTKGRTCRACHEVHASKLPFHIREALPFGGGGWMLKLNYERTADGGSCAPDCHEPQSYRRGEERNDEGTEGLRD